MPHKWEAGKRGDIVKTNPVSRPRPSTPSTTSSDSDSAPGSPASGPADPQEWLDAKLKAIRNKKNSKKQQHPKPVRETNPIHSLPSPRRVLSRQHSWAALTNNISRALRCLLDKCERPRLPLTWDGMAWKCKKCPKWACKDCEKPEEKYSEELKGEDDDEMAPSGFCGLPSFIP